MLLRAQKASHHRACASQRWLAEADVARAWRVASAACHSAAVSVCWACALTVSAKVLRGAGERSEEALCRDSPGPERAMPNCRWRQ